MRPWNHCPHLLRSNFLPLPEPLKVVALAPCTLNRCMWQLMHGWTGYGCLGVIKLGSCCPSSRDDGIRLWAVSSPAQPVPDVLWIKLSLLPSSLLFLCAETDSPHPSLIILQHVVLQCSCFVTCVSLFFSEGILLPLLVNSILHHCMIGIKSCSLNFHGNMLDIQ